MRKMILRTPLSLAILFLSGTAYAQTCVGNCGTSGPDGVVTAPPGGTTYNYVSTNGGVAGSGQLAGEGGTNGSTYMTSVFSAGAGDDRGLFISGRHALTPLGPGWTAGFLS